MFDKQYRFTGSHAEMVSALTSVFDDVAKAKLFERNLDVYMNAPLIGFLFKRKGSKDSDGAVADQNIFPEQLINNQSIANGQRKSNEIFPHAPCVNAAEVYNNTGGMN